jgi:hypothetical protein
MEGLAKRNPPPQKLPATGTRHPTIELRAPTPAGHPKRRQLRRRTKRIVRHGNVVVGGDLLQMRNALILLVTALLAVAAMPGGVDRATAEQDAPSAIARMMVPGPEYDLIRALEGDWNVQQRVWPGPGAEPIALGPMVAERRLIGEAFLQEVMKPAPGSKQEPFARHAYLSFNNVDRRYEYASLDTRYPRTMYETSFDGERAHRDRVIEVFIEAFTHPGWGKEFVGQAMKQRREIIVESDRRNVVRQFWTPPGGSEFLAIEYVYVKRQ